VWARIQLMAIQVVMTLVVECQVLPETAHAWQWAATLLLPSAVLLLLLRTEQKAILWLTTLDTIMLLLASAQGPTFGIPAALGVVVILLLISYSASVADRIALSVIVGCVLGITVDQWGLLKVDHALFVPLAAIVMVAVSGRLLPDFGPVPLTDEPASSSGRDMLTGLPNRQAFLQHVWRSIRWRRLNPDGQFAVLFLDLDNFKPINDHLGHKAGDIVLQRIAKRLQTRLKSADVAARYGGDEFVLLLNQVHGHADVARVADRLVAAIQEPINVGQLVSVGASIGIAMSTNVHAAPEDLIKDADAAMYRAKSKGKNHYVFSEQTEDASPVELKARLRRLLQAWAE
jgi:diguanylate cyclase (GGDEF)-like protein